MKIFRMTLSVLIVGLVAFTKIASANTITPELVGFTPGTSITYSAKLTSGELHAGDGFTIFDIGGFTGFGTIAAGWTATAAAFGSPWGIAPSGLDQGLMNVTFTYAGPTIQNISFFTPLGSFEVLTLGTDLVIDDWTSRDHLVGTIPIVGDGGVGSPHTDTIAVTATVPEPATLTLLGLGLLGAGGFALRRRSSV